MDEKNNLEHEAIRCRGRKCAGCWQLGDWKGKVHAKIRVVKEDAIAHAGSGGHGRKGTGNARKDARPVELGTLAHPEQKYRCPLPRTARAARSPVRSSLGLHARTPTDRTRRQAVITGQSPPNLRRTARREDCSNRVFVQKGNACSYKVQEHIEHSLTRASSSATRICVAERYSKPVKEEKDAA